MTNADRAQHLKDHTVYIRYIPESILVPDKRLGRHVKRDNRALIHRESGQPLISRLHQRRIPILNQGNVGSCTGNAMAGMAGSDPVFSTLGVATASMLQNQGEQVALTLYSAAETLDGDGPYPPNDNGSSGPSVSSAAKRAGLISHYVHCYRLNGVLDALSWAGGNGYCVILGTNWYDSMDQPDSSGRVTISPGAVVRGGHEYLARGLDVDTKMIYCDNSWGPWGVNGSFEYTWDTLERLLGEEGDGCVGLPIGASL